MITKRLPENSEGIAEAARILKDGGIVAIPTETVYGLAADARNNAAVEKVFVAKGRPQDNPLIVHISDIEMLRTVATDIPKKAYELAERFWPGPLTMVLPRDESIPACVSAGLSTVAVRMPSHEIAHNIIKASGLPLAAPSANASGSPSPTKAAHVLEDLDGRIDAVVTSGDCEVGVESTVVTLCTNPPRLLRPGGVTVDELKTVLPTLFVDPAVLAEPEEGKPVASPGMKYKHYSPKSDVIMVCGEGFADFVNSKPDCGALCFSEEEGDINRPHVVYGSEKNPETLAEGLFAALREADTLGVATVYAHAPKTDGVGLAVYNRLIRAAGFKVMEL
jgi:L-threonylcarbamoyladenylate synthase